MRHVLPPSTAPPAAALRLAGAASRVFGPPPRADRPIAAATVVRYYADLSGMYGVPYRGDLLQQPNTFTRMAEELLDDLGLEEPVDVAVIAHATPDADPRESAGCRLAHIVPGAPLAFAVSAQGLAAPFTALRLVADQMATAGCRTGLVLAMEQTLMPYDTQVPPRLAPAGDAAVALVVEATEGTRADGVTVRQMSGIAPAEARTRLEAEWGGPPGDVTLIPGPGLAGLRPDGARVITPEGGRPCTGIWAALAAACRAPAVPARVLAADYEPDLGILSVCEVTHE
ncbi:hypothetical protein ABGB18_24590 [Nonomuraea sp. B12E4]|uniref:hypothetical protein n=1 Tax=Nonomuraea sp. B12E4 TaxID=3153564 RepID=UPI00325CA30C